MSWRGVALLLLAGATAACAADASTDKETPPMNSPGPGPRPSRPAPPQVAPVERGGVRYQQDLEASRHGGTQRGGYLVAVDAASGERLWMLKVYFVPDHSAAGVSSPGRYFRRMTLAPGGDELEIENEVGGVYKVDLAKRTSTWVSGPDSSPP
jgi:hypothetical protein